MKNNTSKNRDRWVHWAIYLIIGFVVLSSALSFWNRYVTGDTRRTIDQTERVKLLVKSIESNLLDEIQLSLYEFGFSKNTEMLGSYEEAVSDGDSILLELERNLSEQNYPLENFLELKGQIREYVKQSKSVIEILKTKDTLAIAQYLSGTSTAFNNKPRYHALVNHVTHFENQLEEQARSDYEWSIADNAIIQIILIVLSIPILVITSNRLKKEVASSNSLLVQLDNNNKQYLYNDGQETTLDAKHIVEKSIGSLKTAFAFVGNVSKGKFEIANDSIPKEVRGLNDNTLVGALLTMSSRLQSVEQEEHQRQWISTGLNEFYGIVRNNQNDLVALASQATTFLTRYLKSQQGSLFLLTNQNGQDYLELKACYAFERKKWVEKRIEIGTGLVGQTFLEGEHMLLTEVPNGYTEITSGLGHVTPSCLLIVPLQYNRKTEAVFEIAGFVKYEAHQIEFIKRAGEFLASAIQNGKRTNEMETLLAQSREQAEILRAQEEELRQSMEELQATNEEIARRERELRL
jgi:CHASE3 domain sensor protein